MKSIIIVFPQFNCACPIHVVTRLEIFRCRDKDFLFTLHQKAKVCTGFMHAKLLTICLCLQEVSFPCYLPRPRHCEKDAKLESDLHSAADTQLSVA